MCIQECISRRFTGSKRNASAVFMDIAKFSLLKEDGITLSDFSQSER